jgi:diazepam-binding inhibitor (GABA receptor modulating acyl-CoA-binding protein)
MSQAFEEAAAFIHKCGEEKKTNKFSDEEKLKLYSLYKQGSIGNVNTDRPGMLDFKGKAKWDAWNARKNQSKEQCQQEYVAFVAQLKAQLKAK